MPNYYGPKVTTDGILLSVDFGNVKSYPGSGTTIYDLGGNNYNGTIYNGAVFSGANSGIMSFDGANDYVGFVSPSSRLSWTPSGAGLNSMTVEMWVKSSDSTGRIFSKPWNGSGEYNYWIDGAMFGLGTGGAAYYLYMTSFATGLWEHIVGVVTPTTVSAYKGGVLNAGPSAHGLTSNTSPAGNLNVALAVMTLYPYEEGAWNYPSHAVLGDMSIFRMYNRALSAQEILDNYNAAKTRFGL